MGLLLAATATALLCAAPAQAQPPGGSRLAEPGATGPPVGIAQSFPTHCGVESLAAGHEGNVWFTCDIETNYGYGSRVKVGRVTPAGQVTEFGGPFPKNLQPGGIVAAANGDLWFPISSLYILLPGKRRPPEVARVTPSGEVTTYRPGLGAKYDIQQLVASPNGYLWFSAATSEESKNPSLWQISPQGAISKLPIDLGPAAYTVLEVGPEGDLWFTKEPASGSAKAVIVRLAPSGELTEFGATIPGFSPSTPGFAADGTAWFFRGATEVGRITAAGEITDTGAKLETGGGIVGGSTFGSDGNLWFGFQSGAPGQSAIERVTPTGTVTAFRDCLRYSQPYFGPASLVTGADGDIWFTSIASRELPGITDPPSIGRITPSGEITQIYAGVNAEARSILAGPDGAIWFSAGQGEIQRIAPVSGPINTVRVAPLKRVAASGAATVRVVVPGPGRIELKPLALLLRHHKRVPLHGAAVTASSTACGTTGLRVKPVGAAKKTFRKRREAIEEVAVTYTPSGGTPYTETAKLDFYAPRRHGRLLAGPPATTARNVEPLRVPQAGRIFPVRPPTLRFSYQPPGSYGDEETSGRPLYPPFWITGLGHWQSWHTLEPRRGLRAEAIAHGWLHYDTCDPNCPHGRYAKVRARVRLDGEFECEKRGHFFATFDRLTVTPAGGPPRSRFIQCTGRVRSGRKSDVIPAGVGFYR